MPAERPELIDVLYRRWCRQCLARQLPVMYEPGLPHAYQVCSVCGTAWAGRALVGAVEERGRPWPAVRLRLTDGHRSVTYTLTDRYLQRPGFIGRLKRVWLSLERQLGGGLADQDQATPAQLDRARRRRRDWDWTPRPADAGGAR